MIDYVYPDGNEKEFLKVAQYLKIDELFFIYRTEKNKKEFDKLQVDSKIKLHSCIEKKQIVKRSSDLMIYRGSEDLRKVLMSPKVDIIVGSELNPKKDFFSSQEFWTESYSV